MNIYAISDLHLSGASPKPMHIFGENWENHWDKIKTDWHGKVTPDDLVLIPGDLSWAMHAEDAKSDIDAVCEMPGRKVILRGNHDYWWGAVSRVRAMLFNETYAIQNDSVVFGNVCVAGTRGWICSNDKNASPEDEKIYLRELGRMRLSLESAKKKDARETIVMMHYPPFNENKDKSGFTDLFFEFGIQTVIYGHLHDAAAKRSFNGELNGVFYSNVSCDFLDFQLKRLR